MTAETAGEMIKNIRRAEEFADIIEVRFDALVAGEIDKLLALMQTHAIRRPVLAAMHTICNSDTANETEAFEWDVWGRILRAKVSEYFDPFQGAVAERLSENRKDLNYVPFEKKDLFEMAREQKFVFSYHFDSAPQNLSEIYERMAKSQADILKFAVQVEDASDAVDVWKLIERAKRDSKEIIVIGMGEAGKWTRILGLAHGAFMTFAALDAGAETAPGQLTAQDVSDVYRVKHLDQETKVYGVLGDPVVHSLSPFLHNSAFAHEGVNAVFMPLLVKDLDQFIRRMVKPATREVELNFAGFAVTMPHKLAIIKHLDALDPMAEKIGAVNTVKITDDGKLTGYNTDADGFIQPLKEKFGEIDGARVAVFGSGGASIACVFALKRENYDVTVFARDARKAKQFSTEFGVEIRKIPETGQRLAVHLSGFDVVVNATPIGMKGPLENESLLTANQLKGVKFVYDLVTSVVQTPLIREANIAGITAIGGFEMLIAQGARQFEIWTGRAAPLDLMRKSGLERMSRFDQ